MIWVIEYSESELTAGRFPWHLTTKKRSDEDGPGEGGWIVVKLGTLEECHQYLKEEFAKSEAP